MTKQELRLRMKELRGSVTPEESLRAGEALCERIRSLSVWKECDALYTFVSCRTEISTMPLMEMAWREGKPVAVPRVEGTRMEFYEISSAEELCEGYMGILEPRENVPAAYEHIFFLMPGLAFDRAGNRLGYGGGFYDRYAGKHRGHIHCLAAAGYDFQLLQEIPIEGTDVPADVILLPEGCFFPNHSV